MTRGLFALDRTRKIDRPAVKQQLFGQGRFAGVGVRDDRKRAAFFDLFGQSAHKNSPKYRHFQYFTIFL